MSGTDLFLALAGGLSAAGAVADGNTRAADNEFMALIAEQQARRERQIAARQARDFEREQSRRGARARSRRAGSGVTGGGTPLLVEDDIAGETALGALDILNNGLVSATRLEQQARLDRLAGRRARERGLMTGGATLLRSL